MKKFEFLEHTADAKVKAYGKDLGEAFANAGYAMASLVYDYEKVKSLKKHKISVEGNDLKQLLYNFLEEILFVQDSEMFALHEFSKMPDIKEKDGKYSAEAEIIGDDIGNYDSSPIVKAVTYNEMEISEKPLYVQVVLDT